MSKFQESDHWQVSYPDDLVRHIDQFRKKYFRYEIYDKVLLDYIREYLGKGPISLLSLGCGTAWHEINLDKFGLSVVGVDRHKESMALAQENITKSEAKVRLLEWDFIDESDSPPAALTPESFDVILMLMIPVSIADHASAIQSVEKFLRPGGIVIVSLFGWEDRTIPDETLYESNTEVVDLAEEGGFGVRLNYYEYDGNMVDWSAIYLVGANGESPRMYRDRDLLEVSPERMGEDPVGLPKEIFELLPSRQLRECGDGLTPPRVYEYFAGWKKRE